jgi:hypothetical protein
MLGARGNAAALSAHVLGQGGSALQPKVWGQKNTEARSRSTSTAIRRTILKLVDSSAGDRAEEQGESAAL